MKVPKIAVLNGELIDTWSSTSEGQLGESIDSTFDETAAALRDSGCPPSL